MLEKFLIKVLPIIWMMAEGAIAALGAWHIIPLSLTIALLFGSAFITSVLYDIGMSIKAKRIKKEKRNARKRNKYRTMMSPYDPDFKMIELDE